MSGGAIYTELIPGVNVDRIDVEAGLEELKAAGWDPEQDPRTFEVVFYALQRWARGEETAAQKGAIDKKFHGIDLTSWLRVLAAARSAGERKGAREAKVAGILAKHTKVERHVCHAETLGPVVVRHSSDTVTSKVLKCTRDAPHPGVDHKDAVCCWTFHEFSADMAGKPANTDYSTCAECSAPWPCDTIQMHTLLTQKEDS